jgi:hypothetical protein
MDHMFLVCSGITSYAAILTRFGVALALVSCEGQAANRTDVEKAAAPSQPTYLRRMSNSRAALAAIRTEWAECRERAFGPPPLQVCDDRAIHAADALVPRTGASHRLADLEADLFEPLLEKRTGEGYRFATQVVVIYSFAELAQRRAAILTGASSSPLPRERVRYSLLNLLLRAANQRDRVIRQIMGPRPAQSWRRRWLAIRNEDCAAHPVSRCAQLLDGALRGMLYDNLSNGGERRLPG